MGTINNNIIRSANPVRKLLHGEGSEEEEEEEEEGVKVLVEIT